MPPTQLTKRRWAMLFLFTCYSMCNAFQWLQYGIINNIFMRFYNVNSFAIDWMSMVYMLTYIPFIFPTIWLLDKTGLRVMAIVASSINCLGAWIKVASVRPDLFWVTMLGQFASALAQVFILGMPSHVASVWFGPDEVSSASSIGVAGNQIFSIGPFGHPVSKHMVICVFFTNLNAPSCAESHPRWPSQQRGSVELFDQLWEHNGNLWK